ncbi:hypothetical protein F2P56_026784 [Juglans regia]|uniref:Uncharacterized protein n=2 Tax=Juglans regia TaxID=51240 RepID=A0A833U2C2_JUGRE|nr:uncharacterized protein LOC109012275 [Juglans regia]KAF5451699.1 hypothetical protein F2P56_026784 [Juglans regia]
MLSRIAKLKPLGLSMESSSSSSWNHQFLQRCSVSGTAKGKAKIKTGQTLKRFRTNTKKGATESTTAGGSKKPFEREDRLEHLCLNAPTPVRYLNPRERAREVKREKLGLVSKDRQRELDLMKKKNYKEKMGIPETPTIIGTPGLDLISLGLVDADKIPQYELTVEDGRRLAKEYSRVLMRRHRTRQAAESNLLRLKKEAIEALPEDLRAAALVPDLTPFPANRFMATLTPPIEGYIDKVKEAAKKSSGKEKLR